MRFSVRISESWGSSREGSKVGVRVCKNDKAQMEMCIHVLSGLPEERLKNWEALQESVERQNGG
jgi:hypothetical protein